MSVIVRVMYAVGLTKYFNAFNLAKYLNKMRSVSLISIVDSPFGFVLYPNAQSARWGRVLSTLYV